jgi:hypothetical protein
MRDNNDVAIPQYLSPVDKAYFKEIVYREIEELFTKKQRNTCVYVYIYYIFFWTSSKPYLTL